MVNRWLISLWIILGVSACRPDAPLPTIAVSALLVENQQAEVRVTLVEDFTERPLEAGSRVSLIDEQGAVWLLEPDIANPFVYRHPAGEAVIQAGLTYRLEVSTMGQLATGEAHVPEAIELVQVSSTQIPVNAASTGQPIFTVLWAADPDRSKVLVLHPLDAVDEIPFNVPSGTFATQYRLPVPGSGTTLFDTDFKYYGLHVLEIFAIDKPFEELFFYTPTEGGRRLTSGPSNIQGGAGYLAGASRVELVIEILP